MTTPRTVAEGAPRTAAVRAYHKTFSAPPGGCAAPPGGAAGASAGFLLDRLPDDLAHLTHLTHVAHLAEKR
jgi:hypothetical protein